MIPELAIKIPPISQRLFLLSIPKRNPSSTKSDHMAHGLNPSASPSAPAIMGHDSFKYFSHLGVPLSSPAASSFVQERSQSSPYDFFSLSNIASR